MVVKVSNRFSKKSKKKKALLEDMLLMQLGKSSLDSGELESLREELRTLQNSMAKLLTILIESEFIDEAALRKIVDLSSCGLKVTFPKKSKFTDSDR